MEIKLKYSLFMNKLGLAFVAPRVRKEGVDLPVIYRNLHGGEGQVQAQPAQQLACPGS